LTTKNLLVEGDLFTAVRNLAVPLLLNRISAALSQATALWLTGRLGPDALAAVGFCAQLWVLMFAPALALSVGATAVLSRLWGAGKRRAATSIARLVLTASFITGLIQLIVQLLCGRGLLHLLGAAPAVADLGWRYLSIDAIDHISASAFVACSTVFLTRGDARTPMRITFISSTMVIVSQMFFCLRPFQFGIIGIAMAWPIGNVTGLIISFWLLAQAGVIDLNRFRSIVPRKSARTRWLSLMRIGVPSSMQNVVWASASMVLLLLISQIAFPTACQAAWNIGLRIEDVLTDLPSFALASAAGTLVGQNLGAGKPDRAMRAGWYCAIAGFTINVFIGGMMFVFAKQMACFYTNDPKVIEFAVEYIRISGLTEPFIAMWIILFGAMDGAGFTRWPMYVRFVCLFFIRIPLAWMLATTFKLGALGIWLAIGFSTTLLAVIAAHKFRKGEWKRQSLA